MTTPGQGAALFQPPPGQAGFGDLVNFVGQGAFQVGAAAQNWGQNVTEGFARAIMYGPAALLVNGWESIPAFLSQLGSYLMTLPLEALRVFQAFIPDFIEGAFETVAGAVSAIINALSIGNLQMTLAHFQQWISDVFDLIVAELHQIMDIVNNLVITPITSRVSAFQDWFNSLTGLATGVSGVITGTPPSPATFQDAVTGAVEDLGSLLNNIQQGATGAVNSGQQATAGVVQDVMAGLNGAVGAAQAQVAQILGWLAPRPPAVTVGGAAPTPVEVPTGWESDWTISGSASGSETVVAKGWSLVKSGHTARRLVGMHNTKQTDTDYQSVRLLLNTNIETPLAGGSGLAGNGAVFRADDVVDPQNYGELRLYYNKIELWGFVSGTGTLLKTWSITPVWGTTYSLDCGTASGLNYYQLRANGLVLDSEFHDSANVIQTGSGFRWGGQTMYTDNRGGTTETGPGVVGYWKLSDNPPTQKVGSGFKVCRVSTTGVSFASGTHSVPADFYDTVDRITPDYTWDASQSQITVRDEGYYVFTIGLPFLASNGTLNMTSGPWAIGIAVNGDIDSMHFSPVTSTGVVFPTSPQTSGIIGATGVGWTSPPIYCPAGADVVPVYSTAGSMTISGGYGTQTAFERTTQYFAGAKYGQVVV